MGLKAKKQRIGYALKVNQHNTLGLGIYDNITSVEFDDKNVWSGEITSNATISINKPNLFGEQGGVVGDIDIEFGELSQTKNTYMQSILGNLMPAFRGVLGMVLKNVNIGMNPSLRTISTTGQRIHRRNMFGDAQWYDEKAAIPRNTLGGDEFFSSQHWDYKWYSVTNPLATNDTNKALSLDLTGWTTNVDKASVPFVSNTTNFPADDGSGNQTVMWYRWVFTPTGSKAVVLSVSTLFAFDIWVNGVFLQSVSSGSSTIIIPKNQLAVGTENVIAMRTSGGTLPYWLYGQYPVMSHLSTSFSATGGGLANHTIAEQVTQEIADLAANGLPSYTFGDYLDTTHGYGTHGAVPPYIGAWYEKAGDIRQTSWDSALIAAAYNTVSFNANPVAEFDMNPIHIIREVWTNKLNGLRIDEALIDDTILQQCADIIYNEGLGISIFWDNKDPIAFINKICAHIDAVVREDTETGKLSLKLIRNDYNVDYLIRLDEKNSRLDSSDKVTFWGLINSMNVTYNNQLVNKMTSVKIQNGDLFQRQGFESLNEVTYEGFTTVENAVRAGTRDLLAQSFGLKSRTIYAFSSIAKDLQNGDVFLYSYAKHNISLVPFRVLKVDKGTADSSMILITAIQDKFTLPSDSIIAPFYPQLPPTPLPLPSANRLLFETPYLMLVHNQGQSAVDTELASNPDDSYFAIAASRSGDAINGTVFDDLGAGYAEVGVLDWCPIAKLNADIGYLTTTFAIANGVDLDLVSVGDWLQIGKEMMLIVAISSSSITVKRGILDTTPALHLTNDVIFFWQNYYEVDNTRLINGDLVKAKVLSNTIFGQLPIEDAPEDELNIVGRPARPYNVANLQMNGAYYATSVTGDLVLTFANRNRLMQTSSVTYGFLDGNITPESGQAITAKLIDVATSTVVYTDATMTGTTGTITQSTLEGLASNLILELFTVRDGLESYQKYEIPFTNLNSGDKRVASTGDQRTTSTGDIRVTKI